MDLATLIGLVLAFAMLIGSILMSSPIAAFVDVPSLFIVVGGTFAAALIGESLPSVIGSFKVALKTFKRSGNDPVVTIGKIVELSTLARREGLLALENQTIDDPFFARAVRMAVDGCSCEEMRETLTTELVAMKQRHVRGQKLFKFMASTGPAMGMIGTLIGLVQMLRQLEDPAAIGPAMAVALLTTLYGAVIAFILCGPIANKLERRSADEAAHMTIVLDGIESIVKGQKAQMIRDKLQARLPPQRRQTEAEAA